MADAGLAISDNARSSRQELASVFATFQQTLGWSRTDATGVARALARLLKDRLSFHEGQTVSPPGPGTKS